MIARLIYLTLTVAAPAAVAAGLMWLARPWSPPTMATPSMGSTCGCSCDHYSDGRPCCGCSCGRGWPCPCCHATDD